MGLLPYFYRERPNAHWGIKTSKADGGGLHAPENQVLEFLFYWERAIRPGDLKKELNLKHTTLNSILGRLEKKKLIKWEKYGPVSLKTAGREKAVHLTKHHLIIEHYLKETLDISDKVAHQEALQMAGTFSCHLIEAICTRYNISHKKLNSTFCNQRNYRDTDPTVQ